MTALVLVHGPDLARGYSQLSMLKCDGNSKDTPRSMTALTLAHISDVHLSPITGFTPGYWTIKRGLGFANWHRGRKRVHVRAIADRIAADIRLQHVDHIAVSGDLVNMGLPAEHTAARAWLDALGAADRVSVVPGNHDIYTKRMFGQTCLDSWAPYMTDLHIESTGSVLESVRHRSSRGLFPYVRRLGNVALIGVNSARPTRPFIAAGTVGAEQLRRLRDILSSLGRETPSVTRVVMIHHPPLPGMAPRLKELDDAPALQSVLEQAGADLVLHGHNHTDTLKELACAGGRCVISGVPSSSAAIEAHKAEPLARYHLYKITSRTQIERIARGLAEPDGPVIELGRKHLVANVAEQ
jgi:3',5'-cyclic AMP phosphodiesterase CpdA